MGIFVLAWAYRGLFFPVIGGDSLVHNPVVDASYHYRWAQRIAGGHGLGHGPDDVFKPPLYAYFLAGWHAVFSRSMPLTEKDGLRFQLARALAQRRMKNEALMILPNLLQKLPTCPLRRDIETLYAR